MDRHSGDSPSRFLLDHWPLTLVVGWWLQPFLEEPLQAFSLLVPFELPQGIVAVFPG